MLIAAWRRNGGIYRLRTIFIETLEMVSTCKDIKIIHNAQCTIVNETTSNIVNEAL